MANPFFRFKQFTVHHDQCSLKVCTDACLFGAWIAQLLPAGFNGTILDVGTGTGLLSLMLAQASPGEIDAVEIDAAAQRQAAANFAGSPWSERLRIHAADFLQFQPEKKYGLIISNPPFFEGSLKSADAGKNAAKHDSTLRLAPLISKAAGMLAPGGRLALLLPFQREAEAVSCAANNQLQLQRQAQVRPTGGKPFFRSMLLFGKENEPCRQEVITIHDNGRQYTQAFTGLLQPYYLNL
jgi:tRNA1Val (adenine37-N6)-methyltransferase